MALVPSVTAQIDEKEIFKVISNNFSKLAPYYYVMISNWLIRAYDVHNDIDCLLYTSPSPRDLSTSRMPSSA